MTSSLRRVQRSILPRGVTESVQGRLDPALGRLRAARNLRRRAHVRNAFALSRINAAKLGVMVTRTGGRRRLEYHGSRAQISAAAAKPGNHWCFGRVFHTGGSVGTRKMTFLSKGGFPAAKSVTITRPSLKSAAPDGGEPGSKPLKSNVNLRFRFSSFGFGRKTKMGC